MREYINILLIVTALAIVSCSGGKVGGKKEESKLEYSQQVNSVDVIVLEKTDFNHQLISNGKLEALSGATLVFPASGIVESVRFSEGQHVSKGDIIATLVSDDKKLALESAQITFRKAELDLYNELAGYGYKGRDTSAVSKDMLAIAKLRSGYDAAKNSLERAKNDMAGCSLRAPVSGRIAYMNIKANSQTPTEPACRIIDDSRFNVRFPVLESEYPFVEKGLQVLVVPYAQESVLVKGTVTNVNPAVDKNGQVMVTAMISNPGRLIDGMNVKVSVQRSIPGMLVVPKSAVVIRDNQYVLFKYSSGRAGWTYVNILDSNSDSHAVTANADRGAILEAGDTVIISGNLNLADGSEVTLKQ
ncbi:MAG: efflux RND transporter periplasmic adaptor subunit [Bacteroidales bacterium]|nr:efflux RND transporter periplasmic adaptor subunit [Bacteroidales bacterium]MDY6378633.1 efflux RND transporter periplasmic adaptor subunit [Bacteroidales bacterium]MEE3430594.1 efflux RND transporter periplasmic adaptor subunit [Candidatus Cryptobacteroides sp.]